MSGEELRIGNWVNVVDKDYQVTQILERGVNCGHIGAMYEIVNPIPLTEEWLERFGFKFDGYCSFWKSDIELTKDVGDNHYSVFNVHGNSLYRDGIIQYVHTLQNLYFALTGEELQTDKTEQKVNQ